MGSAWYTKVLGENTNGYYFELQNKNVTMCKNFFTNPLGISNKAASTAAK
jgi:hypothetical protein